MVKVGDAFLLPTPTGYSFGAVLGVDHLREAAVVRSQAGEYGLASIPAVEHWKEELARIGAEVKA